MKRVICKYRNCHATELLLKRYRDGFGKPLLDHILEISQPEEALYGSWRKYITVY